jgi:HD-GYP domain-containing protein (c-di-GMP phosphodiesterase class II)
MSTTIAVEDLRVGMFVQLDGGWMSHPFALSSFRIAEPEQVLAIRRLGLPRVRWVPEKSDADVVSASDLAAAAPLVSPVNARRKAAVRQLPASSSPPSHSPSHSHPQRQAGLRCEEQYAQAATMWCDACLQVMVDPQDAGLQTVAMTRALLAKMLAADEVGIRLMPHKAHANAAHALNVTVISLLLGRALGLSADELMDLGAGALAHDVGKWALAEHHHHVDETAAADDVAAYRAHVAQGLHLGQRMGLSAGALTVLAQHHERADGSGFPAGLRSEQQSLAARIVAIVNCYDRLCNPATKRAPLTPHEAVATLFAQGAARFDAMVLHAFVRLMGVYPVGSLVQLTDDRYALVARVNSQRPLKPCVWVHEAHAGVFAAPRWLDLQQTPDLGIRRSLTAQRLPAEALQALAPSERVVYFFEALAPKASSATAPATASATASATTSAAAQKVQAA